MKGIFNHELSRFLESDSERSAFQHLQLQFQLQYEEFFHDPLAQKTVVVIPSLTLDSEILKKLEGAIYYEERLLCMLLLLQMPRTNLIYITSLPVDPIVVDYYLHQLPGITGFHARERLTLLSCHDPGPEALSVKLLARPRLLQRIRNLIPDQSFAHLACFVVTELERKLALSLNLPVYGCDPELSEMGNKSNSRKIFKDLGLRVPEGFEDVYTENDVANALCALKSTNPNLKRAVLKLNEGFSGDGNAVFYFPDSLKGFVWTPEALLSILPVMVHPVAGDLSYVEFKEKLATMGGIVEVFVEGVRKESPSVQCRITPSGFCEIVSTHDQVLGGEGNQVFLGAHFPAHPDYAAELADQSLKVAGKLRDAGVLGRFGIDFISVPEESKWNHYAIEINLRKGGTTHPFLLLDFLTDGTYEAGEGKYITHSGQCRYYFSSDNLKEPEFKGLIPQDLIEIAMIHGLLYDNTTQEGILFHLIGALSPFGKLGILCIASSPERAMDLYRKTHEVLVLEGRKLH